MPDEPSDQSRPQLRIQALCRWENEGGAPERRADAHPVADHMPSDHPQLSNAELVQLRVRVIALEKRDDRLAFASWRARAAASARHGCLHLASGWVHPSPTDPSGGRADAESCRARGELSRYGGRLKISRTRRAARFGFGRILTRSRPPIGFYPDAGASLGEAGPGTEQSRFGSR